MQIMFVMTLSLFASSAPVLPVADRVEAVDTRRGTHSTLEFSRGNTFPSASLPQGFNFLTPVTAGTSNEWLYQFETPSLQALRIGHQPSPWINDYSTFQVWPMQGTLELDPALRAAPFDHLREVAKLYRYEAVLDNGIALRMAPSQRAAVFGFTYPTASTGYVAFDGGAATAGDLQVSAKTRTVKGYTEHHGQRLYVFGKFVGPAVRAAGVVHDAGRLAGWFEFVPTLRGEVQLRVGTSFISVEQAAKNLADEVGDSSYETVAQNGKKAWQAVVQQVDVRGGPEHAQAIFYSNLARTQVYPNVRHEVSVGKHQYRSPYVEGAPEGAVRAGKMWVNNGFWDTYRAVWPLYFLLQPQLAAEMLQGLVNAYRDGGWMPRWSGPGYRDCMVGTHTDVVFADAMLKGISPVDYAQAYEAAVKNATVVAPDGARGRKQNAWAPFLGFAPSDLLPEAAAWHLEDAINDFGIAQMAEHLGGHSADRSYFMGRAQSFANLYSPSVGFFRGKNANGAWRTPDSEFSPQVWGYEFVEGAPWHYVVPAPFDALGTANLYGGPEHLVRKLDAMLAASPKSYQGSYFRVIHEMNEAEATGMGQYAHANEPAQHLLYMYNYVGAPSHGQAAIRRVLDPNAGIYTLGGSDGGGYLGDEDNGQMSAWYVFSALGFYPASPGQPEYAIGSPLFDEATIHLDPNRDFTVRALGNSAANVYVQSATLRGAPLTRSFLSHSDIAQGGVLELTMGPKPSTWGAAPAAWPTSLSGANHVPHGFTDVADARHATSDVASAVTAFDNDATTLWCAARNQGWLAAAAVAQTDGVTLYTLTSSAATREHDPVSWTLEGRNATGSLDDSGTPWTVLDSRKDERFAWRQQTRVFALPQRSTHRQYRLRLQSAGAARVCVAEVELLAGF